ncbi:hypothetical protein DS745_23060 [Anaerobacillus alkaliphilus]|uniref:Uncharacterized protein n=1 Tax=Anaerobacillus alkaliphilus TaxID=1548597 RepID=A0A4Q0VQE9_9BACI|nr:hypothetical protein [Anaerobacillus alkaliphilus]RXI96585.1 hypothetical protein DS745_23060 [Anaerobacillus alkaliphilus]
MGNNFRTIMMLLFHFVIFFFGLFRILTEALASTPLFVAYIFAITGLIGIVANGLILYKSKT